YGCPGNRHADGLVMLNSRSDKKSNARANEAADRSRKRESAGTAFGAVLLRHPECIHRKIGAAHPQEKEANHEPRKRVLFHVEHVAKRDSDKYQHQDKVKSHGDPST